MSTITTLIFRYGLFAMFLMILLEYACFPVSSEIVLPFSGAVASVQQIGYFVILPVSIAAGLIGTSFCYFVGRFGGPPILDKLMKRFPSTGKPINKSYDVFEKYGSFAVCIGRVIPICRTYIAFVAGAVKMNYGNFLFASFLGISIWNSILIGLGFYLGDNWEVVKKYYDEYKIILIAAILIGLGVAFFLKKSKKN